MPLDANIDPRTHEFKLVGTRPLRPDGVDKVTGRAKFGADATAPGSFAAPHGVAVDSRGDVYVSEVTWTFAVSRGLAPEGTHTFQKFALAR